MSIIITLIPLFGSKSGRFRGGVQRGRSMALEQAFRAETHSVANPLKTQGVPRPVQTRFFSSFFMAPVPRDTCAGVTFVGQSPCLSH